MNINVKLDVLLAQRKMRLELAIVGKPYDPHENSIPFFLYGFTRPC